MSTAPALLLGAVAVGLAGVLAWELGEAGKTPALTTRAVTVEQKPEAPSAAPVNTSPLVGTILARPLFSPSRRPAAPDVVAEAAPAAPVLPRLTGILVTSAGRSAIFAAEPRATVLQEGGQLGRFTVRSIEPGQVVMVGPDGPRRLEPSFDQNRQAPSRATPATALTLPLLPASKPPQAQGAALGVALGAALGPSPDTPEGAKDAMPFNQNMAPSGLAILRHAASEAKSGTPAGR